MRWFVVSVTSGEHRIGLRVRVRGQPRGPRRGIERTGRPGVNGGGRERDLRRGQQISARLSPFLMMLRLVEASTEMIPHSLYRYTVIPGKIQLRK